MLKMHMWQTECTVGTLKADVAIEIIIINIIWFFFPCPKTYLLSSFCILEINCPLCGLNWIVILRIL